jgi:hypothetical protein
MRDFKKFAKKSLNDVCCSHKHEHLKGLFSQRGPLCLQDVLALVEGACV